MKKYIYIVSILLLVMVIQISLKSYGYEEDCRNIIDHPKGLNSLNLIKYINNKYDSADVNYFCSYNKCHQVKNETLKNSISNYLKIQENKGLKDYVIEAEVKGFPITEISFNLCE